MLLKQLVKECTETLSRLYPEHEAGEMVFWLFESLLGTKRYTHIIEPDYSVSDDGVETVLDALGRLSSGEPIQYVLGYSWFSGRSFNVSSDVLIPRPETEILCEYCKTNIAISGIGNSAKILDLCTGSGCIAWTVALDNPGVCVYAGDISDSALNVAFNQDFTAELKFNGALSPVFFKTDVLSVDLLFEKRVGDNALSPISSCFDGEKFINKSFDVILSNPPYVRESEKSEMRLNVLEHEPSLALFVPDSDPLKFYFAIARHSSKLLSPNGFGIVEINESLGTATANVFKDAGFTKVEVLKDLSSRDRFVYFRW